jgi:hypothetical protein
MALVCYVNAPRCIQHPGPLTGPRPLPGTAGILPAFPVPLRFSLRLRALCGFALSLLILHLRFVAAQDAVGLRQRGPPVTECRGYIKNILPDICFRSAFLCVFAPFAALRWVFRFCFRY